MYFDAKGNLIACADEKNDFGRSTPDKKDGACQRYQGKISTARTTFGLRRMGHVYHDRFTNALVDHTRWRWTVKRCFIFRPTGKKLCRAEDLKNPR